MKVLTKSLMFIVILALVSCGTTVTRMHPVGGSKTDAIVQMGYFHGKWDKVKIDFIDAQISAKEICKRWGYKNAVPFGGRTSKCTDDICSSASIFYNYQCTN